MSQLTPSSSVGGMKNPGAVPPMPPMTLEFVVQNTEELASQKHTEFKSVIFSSDLTVMHHISFGYEKSLCSVLSCNA